MFKQSVDKTLLLIGQAATRIEVVEKLKVKAWTRFHCMVADSTNSVMQKIFLSGGFARSQYLFDRVQAFGRTRRIDVERGEQW